MSDINNSKIPLESTEYINPLISEILGFINEWELTFSLSLIIIAVLIIVLSRKIAGGIVGGAWNFVASILHTGARANLQPPSLIETIINYCLMFLLPFIAEVIMAISEGVITGEFSQSELEAFLRFVGDHPFILILLAIASPIIVWSFTMRSIQIVDDVFSLFERNDASIIFKLLGIPPLVGTFLLIKLAATVIVMLKPTILMAFILKQFIAAILFHLQAWISHKKVLFMEKLHSASYFQLSIIFLSFLISLGIIAFLVKIAGFSKLSLIFVVASGIFISVLILREILLLLYENYFAFHFQSIESQVLLYESLAENFYKQGELSNAITTYYKILQFYKTHYFITSPTIEANRLEFIEKIVTIFYEMGRADSALILHNHALLIHQNLFLIPNPEKKLARINLRDAEARFEGTVKQYNKNQGKISLKKCQMLENRCKHYRLKLQQKSYFIKNSSWKSDRDTLLEIKAVILLKLEQIS